MTSLIRGVRWITAVLLYAVGAPIALSDNKVDVLMGRMRFPSLSIHGIEGAASGPEEKTVIPASVTGKFSIRCACPSSPF